MNTYQVLADNYDFTVNADYFYEKDRTVYFAITVGRHRKDSEIVAIANYVQHVKKLDD